MTSAELRRRFSDIAPSDEEWAALTPAEREDVMERLGPAPDEELLVPEGDDYFWAKQDADDALRGYFDGGGGGGRSVYIGREITVYYPGQKRFVPELFVVFDVPRRRRRKFAVQQEGKGLDCVLEVHDGGDRKQDAERNVVRYASLGIPEYFVFDIPGKRLLGYRLEPREARTYQPILPPAGRWRSEMLDLELAMEGKRVRFYRGNAELKLTSELARILAENVDLLQASATSEREAREAAEASAEAERQRAEAERQRAEAAEAEVGRLRAELERLRG